ncbi:D-2-hydroxyacid dehydrogenase [Cellulomonas humilata]|uniref:D-2-hydroxyacid dehydrogenase n=1 Tax=Cellulomonas humilata TaxID=144055 RepID=A0A7Y6DXM1_9CELL|nr:D-2-hydroxyacid dehydrogenase [Cellulomonas humilata]NUU17182.1 D-2-hydroxyacid dehydrogenase [Cellulomonas humilata]
MSTPSHRLRVVVATPLTDEHCALLSRLEPRIDVVCEQGLLPPMRWPGDHEGDPAFRRSADDQARFDALVDTADALYGLPDTDPESLARTIRANPGLRWVHTMAAGGGGQVKAADLTADELARIAFSTSAGPHSTPLAEFALFVVLAGAKSLPRLRAQQAAREWSERWAMQQVSEMTVLVVGMGNIGRGVATLFAALGARVIGVNRTPLELGPAAQVVPPEELLAVVGQADAIVNTLPGTASTHHMIGRDVFAAVKPGVIVASVGRGNVIDQGALVEALQDGRVGFAGLDVFSTEPLPHDDPLWAMDNVLVSPHTAALNENEDRLIAELFAANATRLLDAQPLVNRVDTVHFY